MEQEIWNNGLCREFVKSVNDIIKTNQYAKNEHDLVRVGGEVVKLFEEMFSDNKFL